MKTILCFNNFRPYGKIVEFKQWWNYYIEIMKECEGRPHWAKVYICIELDFQV